MNLKQRLATAFPKRVAWTTVALCAGCCAIPVVALAFGFTAIAGLGIYFERAALAVFVAGSFLFLYLLFSRRTGRACKIDGSCRPKTDKSG